MDSYDDKIENLRRISRSIGNRRSMRVRKMLTDDHLRGGEFKKSSEDLVELLSKIYDNMSTPLMMIALLFIISISMAIGFAVIGDVRYEYLVNIWGDPLSLIGGSQ